MQLMECSDSKAMRRHPYVEKAPDAMFESANQNIANSRNIHIKNTGADEKRH
jgi:hypothetical protein